MSHEKGRPDRIIPAWEKEEEASSQERREFAKQAKVLREAVDSATKNNTALRAENRRLHKELKDERARVDKEKADMRNRSERREKWMVGLITLLIMVVAGLAGGVNLVKALLP